MVSISPGLSTYDFGRKDRPVTDVEISPNDSNLSEKYILRPSEKHRRNLTNFGTDDAIVVVVYDDNRARSLVAVNCRDNLEFFSVTMRYYGTDSAYSCPPT